MLCCLTGTFTAAGVDSWQRQRIQEAVSLIGLNVKWVFGFERMCACSGCECMQSSPHAKATMCKLIAAGLVMFASSLSRSPRLILGCTGRRYDAKQRKLAFYSFSKVHRLASRVCSNDLNKPISDAAYVVKLQHHMHAPNAPCFEHIICM